MLLLVMSCDDGGLLIEPDISEKSVLLIAPQDNTEIATTQIQFNWGGVEDATSYEIQVATPDFDNTQQLLLNQIDSITTVELSLNVGDYQWRVRALNSNYQTPYSTASFKVVPTENFSDFIVNLLSPEDDLITNEADQSLLWEPVDGATLYRIQVLESGTIAQESTTSSNSINLSFGEGDLTWQVRAENGTQNTLFFARNILVDLTIPNTPVLSMPADGATLTSGDVTFEWSRDLINGSVEFDSIYLYRDAGLTDLVLKEQTDSPFTTVLSNDTYFWQVQAFDQAGNQSDGSNTFSITVNQ